MPPPSAPPDSAPSLSALPTSALPSSASSPSAPPTSTLSPSVPSPSIPSASAVSDATSSVPTLPATVSCASAPPIAMPVVFIPPAAALPPSAADAPDASTSAVDCSAPDRSASVRLASDNRLSPTTRFTSSLIAPAFSTDATDSSIVNRPACDRSAALPSSVCKSAGFCSKYASSRCFTDCSTEISSPAAAISSASAMDGIPATPPSIATEASTAKNRRIRLPRRAASKSFIHSMA